MAEERGPIELRIELPEGEELSEAHVKAALLRAAQDRRFVKQVTDFFATSQTESAISTMVRQGSGNPNPWPPPKK